METTQNTNSKNSNKDFLKLLIGSVVLIAGLLALKWVMHYFGLL